MKTMSKFSHLLVASKHTFYWLVLKRSLIHCSSNDKDDVQENVIVVTNNETLIKSTKCLKKDLPCNLRYDFLPYELLSA